MSDVVPTLRLVPPPELERVELECEPYLGPEAVGPAITVGALAFVSLRRNARAFLLSEPGTRLGVDPEAVHDMRVAGRRMRAAFSLFAAYLPKRADALRRELGRLGRSLGAVRDLDVQLLQLAKWRADAAASDADAFNSIEAVIVRKRETERRRLLRVLDGPRYEGFKTRLCAFLRRGPLQRPAIGRRSARLAAPELIGRRYHATRKAGNPLRPVSSPAAFHALRIRAKRFRYALEFHQPLYDGDVAAMIESLTALQDLLGEHQDDIVAIRHLEGLAGAGRSHLPPRALFLMGTIAARFAARGQQLRRGFSKTYRKIHGRRWKALKSSLAAAAPPFAAGVSAPRAGLR